MSRLTKNEYTMDTGEVPSGSLEDIAYLARSENRLQVLAALTTRIPPPGKEPPSYDKRDLAGLTGTSRTTLGRILTEFEDRKWVRRTIDGEYVATPQGKHMAVQFEQLLGSVGTIQELDEAMANFPASDLSIGGTDAVYGIQDFDEVTIHRPGAYDPKTLGQVLGERTRASATHYSLAFAAPVKPYVDAFVEKTESDGWEANELVYSERLIDWYGPNTRPTRTQARNILETTNIRLFGYEGHMPCQLFIFDETVIIDNSQATNVDVGTFVESRNPTVRAWAVDLFNRYKENSTEVTPEDLAE